MSNRRDRQKRKGGV